MSDEPITGGYQPAPDAGQPSGPPAGEPPKPVTMDDLKAAMAATLEEARKIAQSNKDKAVSAVDKKLAQWEKKLQEQGIPVDEGLRQQARKELALQQLREQPDDDGQPQPVAPKIDRKTAAEVQKINALVAEFEADLDVDVHDQPEFQGFTWSGSGDIQKDKEYIEQGLAKARQRLSGAQQPPPANPGARGPTPQGAPAGNRLDYLIRRQNEIQALDPWKRNPTLTAEREKINEELGRF